MHKILTGPRGGKYYISDTGRKVYLKSVPTQAKKPVKKAVQPKVKPKKNIDYNILTESDYKKYMDGKLSKKLIEIYMDLSDKLLKYLVRHKIADEDGNIFDDAKYKTVVKKIQREVSKYE